MKKKLLCLLLYLAIFQIAILKTSIAQTAGVESGAIYKLKCVASNKLLNTSNASVANSGNVDQWTNTDTDSERWIITHLGSSIYTLKNVGSGKFLHLANTTPANSVNVDQYDNTNDNTVKWLIINNGDGSFTLRPAGNTAFSLDVVGGFSDDGINVQLWTNNNLAPQKWTFEKVTAQAAAPTAASADQIFNAWKVKFDIVNDKGFWGTAEMMEIALDAYEVTGFTKYRDMYNQMYDLFIAREGADWMWNNFNDDIAWMSISCVRSYLLTGNTTHLAKGKEQFDKMYARANTHQFGGDGLVWQQGVVGTNSCINGPAMVCCAYLAQATGDNSYYTKAITIYNWSKLYLFNVNTGKVNDYYNGTTIGDWSSTYNQGTYLGASVMLYNYTKDASYLNIANNIASFTKNDMYQSGVMNNEEGGNDLPGFKGIFMRYARRYVVDCNRADYIPWLQLNAKVAYNNRNTQNIITTQWGTRSPETITCSAFNASTAASLMINCPLSTNIVKSAFATIEAENFNYLKGVIVEPCPDGTNNLGGVLDGYYTAYNNIDFGSVGALQAEFRASSGTAGGTLEIRLGGLNGQLIGTANIAGTGGWANYTTVTCNVSKVTGLQNVYLVYKGSSYLFNFNHFKFIEGTQTIPVNGVNVSPTIMSIAVGGTQTITPTVLPTNATNKAVTWTSSNTAIATVSASGLVTAVAAGTATITVKTTDQAKTATCAVTVTASTLTDITNLGGTITTQYTGSPANEGIAMIIDNNSNTKFLTFYASAWVQYQAPSGYIVTSYTMTSANDAAERDPLNWTLQGSNNGTAWTTINTQNAQDFATRLLKRSFSFTNTTSYAYYRLNMTNNSGTILQLAELELFGVPGTTNVPVTGVSLSPTTSSIAIAGTQQLTATVTPTNATNKAVTWATSNSAVATVSASGLVIGVAAGSATITVTTTVGNYKATCAVTVTPSSSFTTTIQAESYSSMAGVATETTTDAGGGLNVGWIEAADWMAYPAVTIPAAGTYTIEYRVASMSGGGSLRFELAGGTPAYGTLSVPSTGGWQTWTTIKHTVTLSAGSQSFAIYALAGGWNINWFAITQGVKAAEINGTNNSLSELLIYPNPVKDLLTLSFNGNSFSMLSIMDMSGKIYLIMDIDPDLEKMDINLSGLNQGMYIVRFNNLTTQQFFRVMKL